MLRRPVRRSLRRSLRRPVRGSVRQPVLPVASETSNRAVALAGLASSSPSLRLAGDPAVTVGRIAYDLRDVRPGDLFAALDGDPFRGHDVLPDAVSRGAAALLVARPVDAGIPQLVAADVRAALGPLAAAFHGHPARELAPIGVTGTDGKTTTTALLAAILDRAGIPTGRISTLGTHLGETLLEPPTRLTTPEAPDLQRLLVRLLDAGARRAVVEASSHGLALGRLGGTEFAVAAVTNVSREHLDFHGDVRRYRRAKALLLEAAETGVVNADDEGALALLEHARPDRVVFYGVAAEVRASDVRSDATGSELTLEIDGERRCVLLRLPGRFNVENALCAAACAHAAGVELDAIAAGLESVAGVPGRMRVVDAGQPFTVVVDYAHTPPALRRVLETLRAAAPRRLLVVVGSAGERDLLKRPLLGEEALLGADLAVFTSEDPRLEPPTEILHQLAAGALADGGVDGVDFVRIVDRAEAIRYALANARTGDCVLLAGKGHERSIVVGEEELPWDEEAVARATLAELGYAREPSR